MEPRNETNPRNDLKQESTNQRGGQERENATPFLKVTSIPVSTARAFIAWSHCRLLLPGKVEFAVGVTTEDGMLVGVAIAGEPHEATLDDGDTVRLLQSVVDGAPGVYQLLLQAAWQEVETRGYRRLLLSTFTDDAYAPTTRSQQSGGPR
ncbi:XF1762 family protein [Streptosporangium saharense]|uniref:XF1762 family protein n=1 Tax=Streptosporangium saharense TaxID=1706840 RepID=UPI003684CCB9